MSRGSAGSSTRAGGSGVTAVYGLDAVSARRRPVAVTVGTFDGVHLGHRALIGRAAAEAANRSVDSAVLTWDRHPAAVLRPDRIPPMLTSPERKIELLEETGVDLVAVLPFDEAMSKWPPDRFASDVLAGALMASVVVVGSDWRFGHKASGDLALLASLGGSLGFEVEGVDLQIAAGQAISSSRIRELVAKGDVEAATTLLGRPFDLDGIVQHGDHRGSSLGFPTANVPLAPGLAAPPRGVYAGRVRLPTGTWRSAAVNVGVNPTFGGDPATMPPLIEAYVLDFQGDLYGQRLRVEFWHRLRDETRFASAGDLIEQMGRDVDETRRLVEG